MSTREKILKASTKIETAMTEKLNAQGRGLHEKINSTTEFFSPLQIRGLRLIASIRNKAVHDSEFNPKTIPSDFFEISDELHSYISLINENLESTDDYFDRESIINCYFEILNEENFKPLISDAGEIIFSYKRRKFIISINEDDLKFFNISCDQVWPIKNEKSRHSAIEAANATTAMYKSVKSYIQEDSVHFCIEMFIQNPNSIKKIINTIVVTLWDAVANFKEEVNIHK